ALIGMSFGAGVFGVGIAATGVIFLILRLVPRVESLVPRVSKVSKQDRGEEEAAASLQEEPAFKEDIITERHEILGEKTAPVEAMTDAEVAETYYKYGSRDALENLTRHLSLNQIFPSDLKEKRSSIKLRRIKSRRFIAYMF
ncbi:MAG: hypothetical protein RL693_2313, partial [Verrucomicrobiota bacterium]